MQKTELVAVKDHVADALDDMAALGEHWTRNRERGRMPSGIRAAMLLVAREALAYANAEEREFEKRMTELCGPEAYARVNGEPPNEQGQRHGAAGGLSV